MIGIVIPDRNDRPDFLANCLRMIERQTMQVDRVLVMNHEPRSEKVDLTERVRIGYEQLKSEGCECVFIIENDDWYSCHYIRKMYQAWIEHNRPKLLGLGTTIYYHLFKKGWRDLSHGGRSSLFCTMLSCDFEPQWPSDDTIFLDIHLWKTHSGVQVDFDKPIALGIKHGIGKVGGGGHDRLYYPLLDERRSYLKSIVDDTSFAFYLSIAEGKKRVPSSSN